MGTDFFDDDLLKTPSYSGLSDSTDGVSVQSISSVNLSRMAKQKAEVAGQISSASNKIETLKSRQDDLAREKRELEELAKKQEEYERGKKEITEKLERCLLLIEKEGEQAQRMVELLSETKSRFEDSLNDLDQIDEELWDDEDFSMELTKALVKVDIAKTTYTKAMAKIDAADWRKKTSGKEKSEIMETVGREISGTTGQGFGYWIGVGLAVTFPLIVVVLLVVAILLGINGKLGF